MFSKVKEDFCKSKIYEEEMRNAPQASVPQSVTTYAFTALNTSRLPPGGPGKRSTMNPTC